MSLKAIVNCVCQTKLKFDVSALQQSLLLQTTISILPRCQNSSEMNRCEHISLPKNWRDGTPVVKVEISNWLLDKQNS
jgi:hypothetical protein